MHMHSHVGEPTQGLFPTHSVGILADACCLGKQEREQTGKLHEEAVAQLRTELEAAAACARDMQAKADAALASASQQQADQKLELASLSSKS